MNGRAKTVVGGTIALIALIAALVRRTESPRRAPGDEPNASTSDRTPPPNEPSARGGVEAGVVAANGRALAAPTETVRDAERAAQLRAALERAFAQPTHDDSPLFDGGERPSNDDGNLDPTYLRERIHEDFLPMARRCYELLQSRIPGFAGRLRLRFRIIAHEQLGGVVEEVSVEDAARPRDEDAGATAADAAAFGDAAFEMCMRESMLTVAFRPPSRGGRMTVSYPFALAPDEPDGG